MSIAFQRVIPVLRIFDVAKAKEFYLDYLGFSLVFEHRFEENSPLFMAVQRGDVRLYLSEHHGDGSPGIHITISVTGIEAFHEELKAKAYRFMKPGLELTSWGTREARVIDPFGNQLVFSEVFHRT